MSDVTGLQGDFREFFDGIAVVFDDEINDSDSVAAKLVSLLRDARFPVVTYKEPLGDNDILTRNLHGAAYIILDWIFRSEGSLSDSGAPVVSLGEELLSEDENSQAQTIKKILNETFCPVFIVTQEPIDKIKRVLDGAGITHEGFHSRILFCAKSELSQDVKRFFKIVRDWIFENPPIYVLKKWECAIRNAKKDVFQELEPYKDWPGVIWETLNKDGDYASAAMLDLINTIVSARVISCGAFAKNMMKIGDLENVENIAKIVSAERYMSISPDRLRDYPIVAGDIFKVNNGEYCVNIRASCDTIRKSTPKLYLLSCYEISGMPSSYAGKDKPIVPQGGQLVRWNNSFIMPYSIEAKTVEVDFSSLQVVDAVAEWKDRRIGRLLPPFLTRLQELYSAHMVREGLPATPECLLKMYKKD